MARTKALTPTEVKSIARGYSESALKCLAGIMTSDEVPAAARVAAAQALLDRGWGKPTQPLSGDGELPLKIVIDDRWNSKPPS